MSIVVNGVTYALTVATAATLKTLAHGKFFFAFTARDRALLIAPIPISESTALWMMKNGHSVYTPLPGTAERLARAASGGSRPVWREARAMGYFNHYKRVNPSGKAVGQSHAFYGMPRVI